jgi:hypothetical protein
MNKLNKRFIQQQQQRINLIIFSGHQQVIAV